MKQLCAAVGVAQLKKLDWINDRTRTLWKQLGNEIKLPSCAKFVEVNDEGLCGYNLGILFEKSERCLKAINANIEFGGLAAKDTKGG